MKCYHIHIEGRVQGVGFRPYIYRLAIENKLNGWVSNTTNGVHIEFNAGDEKTAVDFCKAIKQLSPQPSSIENISCTEVPLLLYEGFNIRESGKSEITSLQVTPDFAICDDCVKELFDKKNRRYFYPFLTCTRCGPRYSIIRHVPYDRETTTMDSFKMCPECLNEYNHPSDRRFYSQTNSCHNCSVHLFLYNGHGKLLSRDGLQILDLVYSALREEKIIAIKGIGGYLLMADASSATAIRMLRKRKQRPTRPFALMYPDQASAELDVEINQNIAGTWSSPESPIVLCHLKTSYNQELQTDLIAPGLSRIGIMLPYTPIFHLVINKFKKPLVATSGNLSGAPIIYRDTDALEYLSVFSELILSNDREILIPQDDSVIQYSKIIGQKIILRRSRGLAPSLNLKLDLLSREDRILSLGAMLKSTFGIAHQGRLYVSQFLGDSATLESQQAYELTLNHLRNVLGFIPSLVLTDKHPDYPSTMLGRELAKSNNANHFSVQHHRAHAYAVLAENNLLDSSNILSIVWDGTGYGTDNEIWGGEFFIYGQKKMTRVGHIEYFKHILGDKMALEPRISALCLSHLARAETGLLKKKFSLTEWQIYNTLLTKENLLTSSVGRVFDGVASILGLSDFNTYEGESSMYLETAASEYFYNHPGFNDFYPVKITDGLTVGITDIIRKIIEEAENEKNAGKLAAKFHLTLVQIIKEFALRNYTGKISFSGGVFQNALLADMIQMNLSSEFDLYFHKDLSPNDECISLGQIVAYLVEMK